MTTKLSGFSVLVLVCVFVQNTLAQTEVYESAELGPTGAVHAWYTIEDRQLLGCRFHLPVETDVTAVGGHLFRPFRHDGSIFAAITRLESLSALPAPPGPPFMGADVVATGLFSIESSLSADYVFPLSVTLPAGDYALIFGSGLFGDPHSIHSGFAAGMPANNTDLPGASYIAWSSLPTPGWRSGRFVQSHTRFVVYGIPRNPPVAIVQVSPILNACPTTYCDTDSNTFFVVAPPDDGASVILDASASYDPDGDPLTFAWAEVDGAQVFSTNVITTQIVSEDTQFALYVSDGRYTVTNTFTVIVRTPEQVVIELIDTLDELEANQSVEFRRRNSLEQFLGKAAQLFAAGENVRAIKQLRQFQNAIQNQAALIGVVHAHNLISVIEAVIQAASSAE